LEADSFGYNRIALHLFNSNNLAVQLEENATFTSDQRTLGYPLFLYLGYLIGGHNYAMYVVIAAQLAINIVFTWGCWRLLQRIAPDAGTSLRFLVTLLFFWAGMGLALSLMTDFIASFCFGVFLYGMLFWRYRFSGLVSGTALALATLIRPTFTFIPLLLPPAAYLTGRITTKVPRSHLVGFVLFSLLATGASTMHQYAADGYFGPSPALTPNIERTIYFSLKANHLSESDYIREFEEEIERRAGQPFTTLTRTDLEKYAKEMLLETLVSHPAEVILYLAKNVVKYIFVPIESATAKLTTLHISDEAYLTYVRPALGLLCLPIWLFSLTLPFGASKKCKMYYLLVMMFLLYVVGISAMAPRQGERMRFPVLAFMLPAMVWNVHRMHSYISRGVSHAAQP
jgi:hypothetical protein